MTWRELIREVEGYPTLLDTEAVIYVDEMSWLPVNESTPISGVIPRFPEMDEEDNELAAYVDDKPWL